MRVGPGLGGGGSPRAGVRGFPAGGLLQVSLRVGSLAKEEEDREAGRGVSARRWKTGNGVSLIRGDPDGKRRGQPGRGDGNPPGLEPPSGVIS